jgi:aminopeptidase N
MARTDPHSYFESEQPRVRHMDLDWRVDFETKRLTGKVVLHLTEPAAGGPLDLDSKGLEITSARTTDGKGVTFTLADEDPILGRRLRLDLPAGTSGIEIAYSTSPDALALQWLDPVQTSSKRYPFLFSQCQAIHARTVVPVQDTPRARVTYRAAVTVPEALTAVMSAGPVGMRPSAVPGTRTFLFDMPQPIPPYLLALAVGELASRDLSPRARVWAEPSIVEAAAWEFAGVEAMIVKAEELFGKYDWDRYDMLVLPAVLPVRRHGKPTHDVLDADALGRRSLARRCRLSRAGALVDRQPGHERERGALLAERGFHSVGRAPHLEALHGEEAAALSYAIGQKALEESLERFGPGSPLTKLRTEMQGVDPDDAFSSLPYEKGSRFLVLIERTVGARTLRPLHP